MPDQLPPHIEHTVICYLAMVFLKVLDAKGVLPTKGDLAVYGVTDPDDYARRGWLIKPVGRFAVSYEPGRDVKAEMEQQRQLERRAA